MAASGFTPLSLYYSATTTNAPTAGNLVNGELAINITDGKLFYKDNSGVVQTLATKNTASGVFTSVTDSGLTSGRVTYASTGGLLADSANLTFNGTSLTLANDATIHGLTVGKGSGAVATNTAVGVSALAANTSGVDNTAIGSEALLTATAEGNTAFGARALKNTTTGIQNTALGLQALRDNTTGTSNLAVGLNALVLSTTGSYNTAVGRDALLSNTTATGNTAVGYQAGYSNTTGIANTFFGNQAGYSSNYNGTAVNCCIGNTAGYSLSTGNNNTFVGSSASGYYVTTGTKNTILGAYNGNQSSLDIRTASNYIVLSDGDGNPRQVIDSSGNVGIGTSSPSRNLDVAGTTYAANQIGGLRLNNKSAVAANYFDVLFGLDGVGNPYGSLQTGNQANSYITFFTGSGPTERMRIDTIGNLGLGVTPSAWATLVPALQLGTGGAFICGQAGGASTIYLGTNASYNAGFKYKNTDYASYYSQVNSVHAWFTAPSGTAGNAITFTQAMTLDASGNLGLGVTPSAWSSSYKAFQFARAGVLWGASSANDWYLGNNYYYDGANLRYINNGFASEYYQASGVHAWRTAASGTAGGVATMTQAMTLDASGNLLVGTSSATSSLSAGHIQAPQGISGGLALTVSSLATRYVFNGGAVNGLLILRDNSIGGTAIWMLDPNGGAVQISSNIAAVYTITYVSGAWGITQSVGAVPKIYSYFMIAGQ